MASRHPHGRVSEAEAARMRPNLSAADRQVLELLTDHAGRPVTAGAGQPLRTPVPVPPGELDELEADRLVLYPPATPEEAERRERLIASRKAPAELSDEELYERLWPEGQ